MEVLLRALRWRRLVVLAVLVPSCLVGVLAVQSQDPRAEAVGVVGLAPDDVTTLNDDLLRLTIDRFAVLLSSDRTLFQVAAALDVDPETLAGAVDVETSPESSNLRVVATMPTEREAVAAAQAVALAAVELGEDDPFMDADVLSTSTVGTPLLSSRPVLLAALVLAALAGAIAVAAALEGLRPRVRTGGDVEAATGARVLGSLPRGTVTADPGVVASYVVGATADASTADVALALVRDHRRLDTRVVLVDADVARRSVTRALGAGRTDALDEALAGRPVRQLAEVHQGVYVVAAGPGTDPDLVRERLPRVVASALRAWDHVVVDAGVVTEDPPAAPREPVLLVVAWGSSVTDVVAATRRLARAGVPLRGVVLTGSPAGASDRTATVVDPVRSRT